MTSTNQDSLTPAMKQYYEMKEETKEAILFFRMWDFYEMFDEDAHIAHKILWINITSRNKNAEKPQPLAGIPYHALEKYLPILVNAWYKVAISEQVSDPNLKWIVKRQVVRIITPATLSLESDSYTTNGWTNMIVSIVYNKLWYWMSYLDLSSSEWKTWEFQNFDDLSTELYKISPKEVILDKVLFDNDDIKNILSKKYSLNIYYYDFKGDSKEKLLSHFKTANLDWFYLEWKLNAQKASALLLDYIESNQKKSIDFLSSISYESFSEFMWMDENTIKNLDLIYSYGSKSTNLWTLFWVLNDTKTSMWARLLRENIVKPLQKIEQINDRLDIIEAFLEDKILLSKVQEKLKMISDIDLILNRLSLWRALPRDLLNLKKSLQMILDVFELIKNSWNQKLINLITTK